MLLICKTIEASGIKQVNRADFQKPIQHDRYSAEPQNLFWGGVVGGCLAAR